MGESAELLILLSLEDGDLAELDELTRQLRAEIEDLYVESIENVSGGNAPSGTKAVDWASIGEMAVTLAPTVVTPLFNLLKSWRLRRPTTPVKITVKLGIKTAQFEYDPMTTSTEDLEALVNILQKSLNK